LLIVYKLHIII